ncbi:MAG: tyrosine-protein phosphatase [Bacilli bacterium]|nr:tyrosine-protein phosphatase [Bacilli bacterium]
MKRIELKGAINVRDLGQTKNEDGKIIPLGLFIRSDSLRKITFGDKFKLKHKLKIKTVIDLRNHKEVEEKPDKKIRGVTYYNFPLIEEVADGITHEHHKHNPSNMPGLDKLYAEIVVSEFAINSFKKIFDVLLNLNNAPVLFHCSVGKDRTGLVTMLLLHLLDVDEKRIAKDYLESNVACIPESERVYERVLEKTMNTTLATKIRETYIVDIKYLNAAIEAINERYGSVDNYIKNVIGITDEQKAEFKSKVYSYK